MPIAFAGTPEFAARALEALVAAGYRVALVLTQPDRPAGRGMRLSASAVAQAARKHGLALAQPASLRTEEARAALRAADAEVLVVAAYGLILPQQILEIPSKGCINIHASLLPRWRGAAPIQRALLAGDATTGVSIMRMDAGLDTGPVLLEKPHIVGPRETTGTLTGALADLGARAIVEALAAIDSLEPRPQDNARATHAPKIAKSEARIDWKLASREIDRRIRAFDPAPGAEARLGEETLKVWSAQLLEARGAPGEIIGASAAGLDVACGEGALRIRELQRAGGRRMAAGEFLRGRPLAAARLD